MQLSEEDKEWLETSYPEIRISTKEGVEHLSGFLDFDMIYNPDTGSYTLSSGNRNAIQNKFHIYDRYELDIALIEAKNSILPETREIGGRIENLRSKLNLKIQDLHAYPDYMLCLCARQAEESYFPKKFNLPDFIQQLVIPFLYSNSFFEQNNTRPWGEHGHSGLGTLEYYMDQQKFGDKKLVTSTLHALDEDTNTNSSSYFSYLQRIDIPGHLDCVCGSKKRISKCHPNALIGLRKLKNDLANLGIDVV